MVLDKVLSGIVEVLFDILAIGSMQCALFKPSLLDNKSISVYKLVISVQVIILVPANSLLSIRKYVSLESLVYPLLIHEALFNDSNLPNNANESIWFSVFYLACENESPIVGFEPLFRDWSIVESYSVFLDQTF